MTASREKVTEEPSSGGAKKQRQQSPAGAKAEAAEPEYTAEQLDIVKKIKK